MIVARVNPVSPEATARSIMRSVALAELRAIGFSDRGDQGRDRILSWVVDAESFALMQERYAALLTVLETVAPNRGTVALVPSSAFERRMARKAVRMLAGWDTDP